MLFDSVTVPDPDCEVCSRFHRTCAIRRRSKGLQLVLKRTISFGEHIVTGVGRLSVSQAADRVLLMHEMPPMGGGLVGSQFRETEGSGPSCHLTVQHLRPPALCVLHSLFSSPPYP